MLELFFLSGDLPANIEKGTYIPLLVMASYVIASFGSYTGLTLATRIFNAATLRQKHMLHWTGAAALGSGIWSMHFIGMLAYKMRMETHYEPWLTVLSGLIAVTVAYFVLQITQATKLSAGRLAVSAVLLGLGICAMHYTGMAAMQMRADLRYMPGIFLLSVAIAVAASGAALWIMFTLGRHTGRGQIAWRTVAALVMGAAICGMHYTGMHAAVFIPYADCRFDAHQNFNMLAMSVIGITGLIFVIALVLGVSNRLFALAACGIIFTLPLLTIVYYAINSFNENIQFAMKEEVGVLYHEDLIDLLVSLQEVRGLSGMARNGDDFAVKTLSSKKQAVRQWIEGVDRIDRSYGKMLSVDQAWQERKKEIISLLETPDNHSGALEFGHYSEVIGSLMNFMEDVADNSNLSVDPQLDTYFLANATVDIMPNIMETVAKIRGLAAEKLTSGLAPAQWADKDVRRIQALYNNLGVLDANMDNALERALRANPETAQFLEYNSKIIMPKLHRFRQQIEHMVFDRQNTLPAGGLFAQATDLINEYDILYDKTADAFRDLLQEHRKEYEVKKNLVLYSSIIAFLGFIALFIFLYRNLSKTERAEHDALQAKIEAEKANATKSEFLANMSHELRTPLNSILGMTRLLVESNGLKEEEHQLADTVFRSSTNLLEIVNDILDLSKIEAGEMELEHIGMDLHYVFHSVVHALDHIAKEKRIPIVRHYTEEKFPYVLGDPTRLSRVLTNLIGNAIKYTDKGHVDVYASCKKLKGNRVEFHCKIVDTGIGIPKEKHGEIFEKFSQADNSITRKYGGTGLGLTITKQLVELMGGAVGLESEAGKGSTFWFTIPFEVTEQLNEDKHIRKQKMLCGVISPEKARVLVAEDHPMNQLLITRLLQRFGIGIFEIAENGLDVLKRHGAEHWDIILMDCHMPEKNGYDTTRDIRDREKTTGAHVPIIAMTANAMVGDKEKCLRYGMDEYVSKPINIDELKEVMGQWIRFEELAAAPQKDSTSSANDTPLDLTQMRTFTEGDAETEKELIRIFAEQSDKNLKILAENCTNGANKTWVEAAHMFKGGVAGIGAEKLRQLCNEAQNLESGTVQARKVLFDKISHEYTQVKNYLQKIELLP